MRPLGGATVVARRQRLDVERAAAPCSAAGPAAAASGKRKRHVDRRDLVDDDERRLIVGADQIAGVDHQRAGSAGDRRADGRVLQLHFRVLDGGAIGGDVGFERRRGRARGVALLARDDAALDELLGALHDRLGVRGLRGVALEVRFGLCSAASSGRRSSVNSSCPAWTSSPCWKLTEVSSPVICARTATVEYASTVPTTLTSSGISFSTTRSTVTGTAGAAAPGLGACASLAEHAGSTTHEPRKRQKIRRWTGCIWERSILAIPGAD